MLNADFLESFDWHIVNRSEPFSSTHQPKRQFLNKNFVKSCSSKIDVTLIECTFNNSLSFTSLTLVIIVLIQSIKPDKVVSIRTLPYFSFD